MKEWCFSRNRIARLTGWGTTGPLRQGRTLFLAIVSSAVLLVARSAVLAEKPTRPESARARTSLRATTPDALSGLALPRQTIEQVGDRLTIDTYQAHHHAVEPGLIATPRPLYGAAARVPDLIRVVTPSLSSAIIAFRHEQDASTLPPRGFRAPILENAGETWIPHLPALAPIDGEASRLVEQRLAVDGLLNTLTRVLQVFGPANCLTNPRATHHRLLAIGFPADLLHHFPIPGATTADERPLVWIETIARQLTDSANLEAVVARRSSTVFDFQRSAPGASWIHRVSATNPPPTGAPLRGATAESGKFAVASESGENEIGLIRMQVGGGWRDGVVAGGSIDVANQMANQFRAADFLISVADGASAPLQTIITNSWRLRRRHQVILCEEPVEPSAWAQDNGKAGVFRTGDNLPARPATLLPRFACSDEGKSGFLPAESYLADGLRAAGHLVLHSPLLFQGGNALCVRAPRTNRRLLILSEGELHRNLALGLSRAEVLSAFQSEFGVDECVVVPVLSYHLDYDVTFRDVDGELLAFINDPPEAARRIVLLGVDALARQGVLDGGAATKAKADLTGQRISAAVADLSAALARQRTGTNAFPTALARAFVAEATDDGVNNLQVFLLALDLMESALHPVEPSNDPSGRTAYLNALRRQEAARQRQLTALREMGCRMIRVPSLHDLYRSINYLNGLQHRGGYVMPTFGGFYTPLDQAAAEVFRTALGPDLRVTPIQTAECQRMHGAVHCTVSVYPKL